MSKLSQAYALEKETKVLGLNMKYHKKIITHVKE